MKVKPARLRDIAITAVTLLLCFGISLPMQDAFDIPEQVTTTFAFGVFLISLLTEGYAYGLTAAMISVLLVNYAFTFPFFAFNFLIPSNFFSAIVMGVISVLTSTLTTRLKQAEALRVEAEKERMRANLLRAISHDLRTPLTTIYGSSTAIRQNRQKLTPEQTDKLLAGIQEDSQWLIRMVENLLSITRIDGGSGIVRLTTVPTALDELIDSVIVKFRNRYPGQKVVLELPDTLVLIPMDTILIEQVLINMLENAIHHAAGMTRLVLRVRLQEDMAVFEIQDNGCGIAPDRLPHIFTGLYNPHNLPADHARRSAGIGLSVCATIIRAHGGIIQAENIPGGGALFRFALKTEDTTDE